MRGLLAAGAMTLGSTAFELALQAGKLNRWTWLAPYLWVACAVLWIIWLATHRHVKAFGLHVISFRPNVSPLARQSETDAQGLVIHSALYGTGPIDDVSVTEKINSMAKQGLVVLVDNNLIAGRPDPAPNQPKRLRVTYSYGSSEQRTIERPESKPGSPSRLVLPEEDVTSSLAQRISHAFKNPHWEVVSRHEFANEEIVVDGKRFFSCKFKNVRFMFHGTAPTEFVGECEFGGSLVLSTDDPASMLYSRLCSSLTAIPHTSAQTVSVDAKGRALPDSVVVRDVTPPSLGERAFALCKEMRAYAKQLGPVQEYSGDGSPESKTLWLRNSVLPWREKFNAGYMLRFRDRLQRIRHELAEKGLVESAVDSLLAGDISPKALADGIEALTALAVKADN